MKKILTSMLTLALALCCFTFVGCDGFKNKDKKPATIEQTLEVLDQFVADMQAVGDKIAADGYVYPANNAIASSIPVIGTDISSIGIEYSNYIDFDYNYDFGQGSYLEPYSPSYNFYPYAVGMTSVNSYFQLYKDNNFQLNTVYEIRQDVYIKLTNDNSKITFTMISNEVDEEFNAEFVITLDTNSKWKSVEYKHLEIDEYKSYLYIEKSTSENRVFDRYISVEQEEGCINLVDLNETTQKMICIDSFETDSMNIIESKVYNYLESLNLENFVNNIDIANAVQFELNLGE